jgi:hypothetical protein
MRNPPSILQAEPFGCSPDEVSNYSFDGILLIKVINEESAQRATHEPTLNTYPQKDK